MKEEEVVISVLTIQGLVQSVGFRPFIYRIASEMNICGEVDNRNNGVCIRTALTPVQRELFIERIRREHPKVASIHRITVSERIEVRNPYMGFRITPSRSESDEVTQVAPDIAVCPECLRDRKTQAQRLQYPFVNCAHCGPRFSIIRDLPYDRSRTTMSAFSMCPSCRKEYITVQCKCRLCGDYFSDSEMSEEHYPARNTGNEDIVAVDLGKMFDIFISENVHAEIRQKLDNGQTLESIAGDIFDSQLATSLFPKGRTARTLCRKCNTFLGKYDEAYLRFFNSNGNPKVVNGFQQHTKYQIIKAIYAKFLSVPETRNEELDFLDFIRDADSTVYNGTWSVYFVKRNFSSDLMGMKDIRTGKITFDEGVVYEMSDDKFIFNLMNFPKHSCFEMTNLFDILKKNYKLIEGVGENGGYHAQVFMSSLFSQMDFS